MSAAAAAAAAAAVTVAASAAPIVAAELIRSKGDTTMTVEQLTAEIIPRGRGASHGHTRVCHLPLFHAAAHPDGAPHAC